MPTPPPPTSPLGRIAAETDVPWLKVQEVVGLALRALHQPAFFDSMGTTAALMRAYFEFGPTACHHLAGLMCADRLQHDDRDGFMALAETMARFDPQGWGEFCESTIREWEARRAPGGVDVHDDGTGV